MHIAIIEPLGVSEQLVHELMGKLEGCTYEYFTERSVDQRIMAERAEGADVIVVANAPVRNFSATRVTSDLLRT